MRDIQHLYGTIRDSEKEPATMRGSEKHAELRGIRETVRDRQKPLETVRHMLQLNLTGEIVRDSEQPLYTVRDTQQLNGTVRDRKQQWETVTDMQQLY